MVRQKWSVNALATELGVDRRTVARHLHEVKVSGKGPHGPLYFMSDVHHALTGNCSDCRHDRWACGFMQHVDKRLDLERLAERLVAADSADARVRVLREFLASHFWAFLREKREPPCPDWAKLSGRVFERCWRALVKEHETLKDAASIAAGGQSPREAETARIRALPGPRRGAGGEA
jgi:hypothetical protein